MPCQVTEGGGRTEERQKGTVFLELRNDAVEWMWYRSYSYGLHPAVAHAAVSLLDRALCFPMPSDKVKLLTACCMMIESHRGPDIHTSRHIRILDVLSLTGKEISLRCGRS